MADDTSFAPVTNIRMQGDWGGVVEYGNDRSQVAMFYNRSVHNPAKSNEAGRPIFEDQVYVRIHPPGERLSIIDRPAKGDDSRRFPAQWAAFQQNKQQVPEGTPIAMLYPDYPSVAVMLRAHGVQTIEQCAELSGPAIDNVGMGCQRYVNDAQKYLSMSNKGVKASQFRHEMESKDREIKVLTKQVEDLKDMVEQMRDGNSAGNNLAQVQQLLATMMQRPALQDPKLYDTQTGIINATHSAQSVPYEVQRNPQRAVSKRQRPKLG